MERTLQLLKAGQVTIVQSPVEEISLLCACFLTQSVEVRNLDKEKSSPMFLKRRFCFQ